MNLKRRINVKTIKKELYYKDFTYPIAYSGNVMEGYIEVMMYFDFKEGLRFSVSVPDYSCCERNIFKAFVRVVEHCFVGYGKYQILKDDCREKGFWKKL
jgi:hypothetical protein